MEKYQKYSVLFTIMSIFLLISAAISSTSFSLIALTVMGLISLVAACVTGTISYNK